MIIGIQEKRERGNFWKLNQIIPAHETTIISINTIRHTKGTKISTHHVISKSSGSTR